MAAGGGAPASNVDHEIFARLNRFEVNENLVINVLERGHCGLAGALSHCACHGLVESLGGVTDGPQRGLVEHGEDADQKLDHLRLSGL
jgi:hypothetical protein